MRMEPRPVSISQRLTRMNMLVSGASLLLAGVAFAANDVMSFRDTIVKTLAVQAEMVASNSITAVVFDDAQAATDTLKGLAAAPNVVSATVYAAGAQPFARYERDAGTTGLPPLAIPEGQMEASAFAPDAVRLARRIVFEGRPVGMDAIQSDLSALYARLRRHLLLTAAIMLVAMIVAWLVSRLVRRQMTQSLQQVAALTRRVSESNDYSLRAHAGRAATEELTTLVDAFNDMLSRIQERDRELLASHGNLEERVATRTAELNAINNELESFSYSVSHDLRAPLRHVTGFATLLERHAGSALDAQGRRYLRTITDAAQRMGTLIDDLLAFSRMGRTALSKRPVDLGRLVEEAQAEVTDRINGRPVDWNVGPLPIVQGDPALLRPALVNLLSNAIKYSSTREVSRVEIGVSSSTDDEVVVFVRDNGVGFDMAYASKLFGVFQRLHRTDEFAGTGIGLANVRRIVQRHGGRTWAEAKVDAGATFYFSLPSTGGFRDGANDEDGSQSHPTG